MKVKKEEIIGNCQITKTFTFETIEEKNKCLTLNVFRSIQYIDLFTGNEMNVEEERFNVVVWMINPFSEKRSFWIVVQGFSPLEYNEEDFLKEKEIREAVVQYLLNIPKYRLRMVVDGYVKNQ